MKNQNPRRSCCALGTLLTLAVASNQAFAAGYVRTDLTSNNTGILPAVQSDPNLVNPWGLVAGPTTPFWTGDNGTGLATVYTAAGAAQTVVVTIPTSAGGTSPSHPTGVIFNPNAADFAGSHFLFASEDGTLSAWTSGTSAVLEVDNSASGANYKGLAFQNSGTSGNHIYASNFHSGHIDVFNSTFAPVTLAGTFTDPNLPAGYAPFNIQNLNGNLFVTFALQSTSSPGDDQPGLGNGFVDVFDTSGNFVKRLVSNGVLNSPWGLALAPANFGQFSNDLLVGNFGDGLIHAFDPSTGSLLGTLSDSGGTPIDIDGLWSLTFGNGSAAGPANTLFFTAGPADESEGLLGSITVPEPASLSLLALSASALLRRRLRQRSAQHCRRSTAQ